MADRPALAVAYGPRSVPVLQLVEAAAGRCELVWMIDDRLPEMGDMARLLRRFGTVVPTGGLDLEAAVAAVGRHRPGRDRHLLRRRDGRRRPPGRPAGLPFYSPETATAMVDKVRQRETMAAAGLRRPPILGRARAGRPRRPFWPRSTRPTAGRSCSSPAPSREATTPSWRPTPSEATELLCGLGTARRDMVAEEYIEGDPRLADGPFADYLSVESVVSGGVVSHVAMTGRFPQAEMFRETGFFIPAVLEPALVPAVIDEAERAIASLGVEIGCLHTELKLTARRPAHHRGQRPARRRNPRDGRPCHRPRPLRHVDRCRPREGPSGSTAPSSASVSATASSSNRPRTPRR